MEGLSEKLRDYILKERISEIPEYESENSINEWVTQQAEELAKQIFDYAFRIASSKMPRYEDIERIAQDAAVKILDSLDQFKRDCSPITWWNTLVRNRIADFYRQRRLETVPLSYDLSDQRQLDEIEEVELNIFFQQVLSEREYQAFALRWFYSMPYKDIAERLGIPLNTVRTLLRNARLKLQDAYASDNGNPCP